MGKLESYSAASVFPSKLLHNKLFEDGKIKPLHIQIIPTNSCNLNCSFCSCSDRDKLRFLTIEQMKKIIDISAKRGTKAMTITGGGEPLMHLKLNELIDYAYEKGIQSGLVTNGVLLSRLKYHEGLTWCRISSSDDRTPAYESISKAIKINPKTDWAFSHVVTRKPDYSLIKGLVRFANECEFSHVRLVSDLFDLDNVPDMKDIKNKIKPLNDRLVIYQGRKDSSPGTSGCYISLLKPIISPEGVFPCCGAQYAIMGQPKDMVDAMKMGEVADLAKIIDNHKPFDGSKCEVCYYSQYNKALGKILDKPEHLEFV